jgi:4-aminobutyrate aminotransferase-like enzyme
MPDTTTDTITRFPERLCLRTPRGLMAAVELAAERRHTSPSEWARQAIPRALMQDGIQLCGGHAEFLRGRE